MYQPKKIQHFPVRWKYEWIPTWNPNWWASFIVSATWLALNIIFFGTQPTFTHVPPYLSLSIIATLAPYDAALFATAARGELGFEYAYVVKSCLETINRQVSNRQKEQSHIILPQAIPPEPAPTTRRSKLSAAGASACVIDENCDAPMKADSPVVKEVLEDNKYLVLMTSDCNSVAS